MTLVTLTNLRITGFGLPVNAGINLWIKETLRLVYRIDWDWYMADSKSVVYTFNDERMATAFALRWA